MTETILDTSCVDCRMSILQLFQPSILKVLNVRYLIDAFDKCNANRWNSWHRVTSVAKREKYLRVFLVEVMRESTIINCIRSWTHKT